MAKRKRKYRTPEERARLVAEVKAALDAGKTLKAAALTFGIREGQYREWSQKRPRRGLPKRARPVEVEHVSMQIPEAKGTLLILHGAPGDVLAALEGLGRLQ